MDKLYRTKHNTATNNFKTHYISYNFGDTAIYGNDTTAIVIGQFQRFYILNGNHFEMLENKTFTECMEYFKNNSALHNKRFNKYCKIDAQKVIDDYEAFKIKQEG